MRAPGAAWRAPSLLRNTRPEMASVPVGPYGGPVGDPVACGITGVAEGALGPPPPQPYRTMDRTRDTRRFTFASRPLPILAPYVKPPTKPATATLSRASQIALRPFAARVLARS